MSMLGYVGVHEPTKPPPRPTSFRPGTRGKIRVMARRAAANQFLHHPLDRRDEWAG
jgi:hypothetical protein